MRACSRNPLAIVLGHDKEAATLFINRSGNFSEAGGTGFTVFPSTFLAGSHLEQFCNEQLLIGKCLFLRGGITGDLELGQKL